MGVTAGVYLVSRFVPSWLFRSKPLPPPRMGKYEAQAVLRGYYAAVDDNILSGNYYA